MKPKTIQDAFLARSKVAPDRHRHVYKFRIGLSQGQNMKSVRLQRSLRTEDKRKAIARRNAIVRALHRRGALDVNCHNKTYIESIISEGRFFHLSLTNQ